jgi:hypothetical protein
MLTDQPVRSRPDRGCQVLALADVGLPQGLHSFIHVPPVKVPEFSWAVAIG